MACGSVAVSKATISQMLFSNDELKSILSKLLGVSLDRVRSYSSSYSDYREVDAITLDGKANVQLYQESYNGVIETRLIVNGSNQAANQSLLDTLQPLLDRALVVAQQTNVLKRLSQLGKLSNIKQKDNGVTARLEINI